MLCKGIYGVVSRRSRLAQSELIPAIVFRYPWLKTYSCASDDLTAVFFYNPEHVTLRVVFDNNSAEEIGVLFSGRIDNRVELFEKLGVSSHKREAVIDADLICMAYQRWREEAVKRILGDWSFAIWHSLSKKLFLARDHFGVTGLYYTDSNGQLVFSSTKDFILEGGFVASELDELYLAQVVLGWMSYHGEATIHKSVKRLPPAHTLTVTPAGSSIWHYWQPENVSPICFRNRTEYVEAFYDVFKEAVRCRLPSDGKVAVALSGGLDSGAVVSVASELLGLQRRRITAYTSVPLTDPVRYLHSECGDEFAYAKATADFLKNVDILPVTASTITPIAAINTVLKITNEPSHAACNYYWLLAIRELVRDAGCKVLLTGQMGNATISWDGDIFSQPLSYVLKNAGLVKYIKHCARSLLPAAFIKYYQKHYVFNDAWLRTSAISLDFAKRLKLTDQRSDDLGAFTPIQKRCYFKPGKSNIGSQQSELSSFYNCELRDPTADPRVIEYTFAVPDHIYIDPATGMSRWLVREAMKRRLPEEVRLNTVFARQSADRVQRLRSSAAEVERALGGLEAGPAAEYVDLPYLRQIWGAIQTKDTPQVFKQAGGIFLRGIMSGLFVNKFYGFRQDEE